jgi:tRNA-2-methylthio-N6-dimethylallyladenosine synthase
MAKKKYLIITYGCQMNKADSERIERVMQVFGYQKTSDEKEADFFIINACSVRQSAIDRVYSKVKDLKNKNKKAKIILTGCILKKDRENFLKDKNVDFIFNINSLKNWQEFIKEKRRYFWQEKDIKDCKYLEIEPEYSNNFSALIPISFGCNNFCTYCAVPYTRGKLILRDWRKIVKEAEKLVNLGFKEIWLLGQNVNDYNFKIKGNKIPNKFKKIIKNKVVDFATLLAIINDIKGDFWIRFTSPHPENFSEKLIKKIAKSQKVTPYLNLPLQSGDDEILRRMNRHYKAKDYEKLVQKIRFYFKKYRKGIEKDPSLSTDIIVGFPGESEKQFQNTVKLFKKIKFDMAYIAKYSQRPGTIASKFKDNILSQEKERRYKILQDLLKKIAKERNKRFLNKKVEVLVEEVKKENNFFWCYGKTRHFKSLKFKSNENLQGKIVNVKVIKADSFGLLGKLL